jgi:hypothetical protein
MGPEVQDGANPADKKFARPRVMHNEKIIYYCRTYMAIFSGCVTGVMGYTGVAGAVCYLLAQTLLSAGLMASMGFDSSKCEPGLHLHKSISHTLHKQAPLFVVFPRRMIEISYL